MMSAIGTEPTFGDVRMMSAIVGNPDIQRIALKRSGRISCAHSSLPVLRHEAPALITDDAESLSHFSLRSLGVRCSDNTKDFRFFAADNDDVPFRLGFVREDLGNSGGFGS